MRKLRHPAVALLVVATLSPTVVWGQPEKVGLVTTLEGKVTAKRAKLAQPVSLKFKDDVFFQDTITTGDQSLARVLFGGKSIVTIRERSVVTISEIPGRSVIDLQAGKIGLAVARERMNPGETVDIRTPNAVVSIRGTVVVAEVVPAAAAVTSNVYFLRGSGECSVLDTLTGRPIGAPVTLKPLESFKVVGSAARVAPIPASQVGQIAAGLESKGYHHSEAANQEQVKTQATQATSTVLNALMGSQGASAASVPAGVAAEIVATPITLTSAAAPIIPPITSAKRDTGGIRDTAGISLTGNIDIPAGQTLKTLTGATTKGELVPFIRITNPPSGLPPEVGNFFGTVRQLGVTDNFVEVAPGATVSLGGPLLDVANAAVLAGDNVLSASGVVQSTSAAGLIVLDPSFLGSTGDVVFVGPGGQLSLAGPLVSSLNSKIRADNLVQVSGFPGGSSGPASITTSATLLSFVGSTVELAQNLVNLGNGGSITGTGPAPLVQLVNSSLTTQDFAAMIGSSAGAGGGTSLTTLTLSGPFLSGINSSLTLGGGLMNVFGGGQVMSTTADPFVSIAGGIHSLGTIPTSVFSLSACCDSAPGATMSLAGPLARLTETTVVMGGDLLSISDGGSLSSTTTAPLIQLVNSSLTTQNFGTVLSIGSLTGVTTPATLTLSGPFLSATDSALTLNGGLLDVFGGSLSSTTAAPLIQLVNSSLTTQSFGMEIAGQSGGGSTALATLTLSGPFLRATESSVVTAAGLIGIFNDASLTSRTAAPLIQLANASLTTNFGSALSIFGQGGAGGTTPSTLTLSGPFLSAINSSLTLPGGVLDVFAGGRVISTTADSFVSIAGSSLGTSGSSAGFSLSACCGIAESTKVFLAGPLARLTGTTVVMGGGLLRITDVASLSSTTPAPLIQLVNAPLTTTQNFGHVLFIGGLGSPSGTAPATLTLSGPFLSAIDSPLTLAGGLLVVFPRGRVTSTAVDPFVSIAGGTHALGASAVFISSDATGSATMSLAGPLAKLAGTTVMTPGELLAVVDGASLSSTTPAALVQLVDATLTTQGSALSIGGQGGPGGTTPATLTLSGPFFRATDSALTLTGGLLGVGVGGQVISTAADPFVSIAGGTHSFGSSAFSLSTCCGSAPSALSLAGPLAQLTGTKVVTTADLLAIFDGGSLSSTTAAPLIQLVNSSLTTQNFGKALEIGGQIGPGGTTPATLGLKGPFLSAEGTSLVTVAGSLVDMSHSAQLTVTGSSDPFVTVASGANLTVGRALLTASNATVTLSSPTLVSVAGRSSFTAGAVLDLTGTSLDLGSGTVLNLSGGGSFTMTQGPFARISEGSLTADALIRADGAGNTVKLTGGLLDLSNATVTFGRIATGAATDTLTQMLGTNEPVINMLSSTLTLRGEESLVSFGVDSGSPIEQRGVALIATGTAAAASTITLNGGLLDLGGVILTDPNPQIQVANTIVSQTGPQSLIEIVGLPVTASGPLLNSKASTLRVDRGRLLEVDGPFEVKGPGVGGLLHFADSTVSTGSEIAFVGAGGKLTLDRGLIDATATRFSTSTFDTFFTVVGGGAVTASTADPFIRLNSSTVKMQPGEDFIHLGLGGGGRASVTLNGGGALVKLEAMNLDLGSGTLVRVTGSDVSAGGSLLDMVNANLSLAGALLRTEAGSTVTTTAGPVVRLNGGSLIADVLASTDGLGNMLNITGPVLDLTNTTVTLRRVGEEPAGSTDTFALTLPLNTPVIRMSGSTLTTTGVDADLFEIAGAVPAQATRGTVLTATGGSTVNIKGSLLRLADIISMATNPLVQLADTTVNQTVTANPLIDVDGTTTLTGQLLAASNSLIRASGAFAQFRSGTLNSNTTDPFLAFQAGEVTSAGNLVLVDGSTLTLHGSLLSVTGSDVVAANNLVRLVNGAQLLANTLNPLVVFEDAIYQGGTAFNTASGGSLLRMFSSTGQPRTRLSLIGPYFSAVNSDVTSKDAPLFNIADGATITSTTPEAFASFRGVASGVSHVSTAGTFFNLDRNTSFTVPGQATTIGSGAAASLSINGALIEGFDVTFTTSNDAPFLRLHNGVTLTQSGHQPLVLLDGSSPRTTTAMIAGTLLSMGADAGRSVPNLVVADGLLDARNTVIQTGNRLTNTFPLAFIGDGSQITLSHDEPFISLDNSALALAGPVVALRRSQPGIASRMTLGGPLLLATNGSRVDTSSLGAGTAFGVSPAACCSGFVVGQGAQLTGTTTQDLIRLVNSVFKSGPDAFSGGNFFSVADTLTGAPVSELVAPATVAIAGRLLSSESSTVTALFSLLGVARSSFTSTTPNALIEALNSTLAFGGVDPTQPENSTTFGRMLSVVGAAVAGTPSSAATVSLTGPLTLITGGTLTTTADLVGVFNGASLSSTTAAPLIQLVDTVMNAGTTSGRILQVGGQIASGETTFSTVTLSGPVLSAIKSALTSTAGLVGVFPGGQLIIGGDGGAVVSISGHNAPRGTHFLATNGGEALFTFVGRTTATAGESELGVELTLGTDQSIQAARTLLETNGATISASKGAFFDHTLFQATAPIFDAKSGSNITTAFDAIDLNAQAKVTSLAPIIALNASAFTVTSGSVVNIAGGSLLRVTNDLFSLANGSTLRTLNGPLATVSGGSVLNVSGALALFSGPATNSIVIASGACGGPCPTISGIPVLATGGASLKQITIGQNPLRNPGFGSLTSTGGNSPAIVVNGPTSRVNISAP